MIGPLDVLNDVIQRFDKIGIQYYLVGSLASMYYSRPRFTNDIDLVVQISTSQIANFEKEFPLTDYYCPPLEILRDEIIRKAACARTIRCLRNASGRQPASGVQ